ncbi:hypothetical protein [Actinomycetospora atypica]|uniref:Uncharacterized protein n=1 Tax=Actinomycetospora atypica TaxID=1290095 RepID=A0ABV9YTU3_9PSEU
MTDTSTTTRSTTRDATNQMMAEAARRMLPVIAGRVLAAVTDRAVEGIEGLAHRLDDLGAPSDEADAPAPRESGSGGGMSTVLSFVVEQVRTALQLLARLVAQAAEMLRRATARLRARQAPEGIDEAPAPEEITAPEDLEDEDDFEDADEERERVGV